MAFGLYFVLRRNLAHHINRHARVQCFASCFACQINHAHFAPRLGQVELFVIDGDNGCAKRVACGVGNQQFGKRHHFGVVAIGLVALHHGELGVVAR